MTTDEKEPFPMTFMDAVALVRDGYAVKRKGWAGHMQWRRTKIFAIHPGNDNFYALSLGSEDILADDWITVDDVPKVEMPPAS